MLIIGGSDAGIGLRAGNAIQVDRHTAAQTADIWAARDLTVYRGKVVFMPKHKLYLGVLWFLLLMSLIPARAVAQDPLRLSNVIVISIDALHPAALKQAKVPNLSKLIRSGAYTLKGRSTEPPKTLIAHTAMFTGLSPEKSGKVDNYWTPGKATVDRETIFDSARRNGFRTGYFYSKEKLGYLASRAVDVHEWSRDDAIDAAESFIKTAGHHFVFLHVSGLDEVGPKYGWLSPEYLEELSFIDAYLTALIEFTINERSFLIIVTSDHSGHGKIHGGDHPDDFRLPLILCSDTVSVKGYQDLRYSVIDLKKMIEKLLFPYR